MVVLLLQRVPPSLRGELTRWLIEPSAGVFVGKVSAMVRDRLWDKAMAEAKDGAGVLIYDAPTEQGFLVRLFGEPTRDLVDCEGVTLVYIRSPSGRSRCR